MAENKKPSNKKTTTHDASQHTPNSVAPDMRSTSNSGGTQMQNADQNHITEAGNETKGNSPGGNLNEVRSQRINKPRNSPNPTQQKLK